MTQNTDPNTQKPTHDEAPVPATQNGAPEDTSSVAPSQPQPTQGDNGSAQNTPPRPPEGYAAPTEGAEGSQQERTPQPQSPQQDPDAFDPRYPFKMGNVDDDSPAMTWLSRAGWFALGFVGGIFGMLAAWMFTSSLSPRRRNQAVLACWIGFACQAAVFFIMMLTGGSLPNPFGSTAATSTAPSTSSAGNAFG